MCFHVLICVSCGSLEVNDFEVEKTLRRHTTVLCVSGSRCLFFFFFFSPFPSCHGVPSSQMDAVKQLNDACFPSLAVAIAAVYMQSSRQTSCNTHTLSYVGALCNYTNITLLTAQINSSRNCNERYVIRGGIILQKL